MSTAEDRHVALDVGSMIVVGVAITLLSQRLAWMTAIVLTVFVARLALTCSWGRTPRVELPFVLLCAAIGFGNDWNTVVRHRVYAYAVPTDLPTLSTIPTWMFFYWGLVLRAIASLASYTRLGDATLAPTVFAKPIPRIAFQLAIVFATRQAIYRLWSDPILSFVPFVIGLVVYVLVLSPPPRARRLALVALVVGPPAEMALIHLGGLHHYAVGVLGGVPVWIALWWALGALVWSDLAPRLERMLDRRRDGQERKRGIRTWFSRWTWRRTSPSSASSSAKSVR